MRSYGRFAITVVMTAAMILGIITASSGRADQEAMPAQTPSADEDAASAADSIPENSVLAQVLTYLPEKFDTLLVAQGPFALWLPDWKSETQPTPGQVLSSMTVGLPLLDGPAADAMSTLAGRPVQLAVEVSRGFALRTTVGPFRYKGCHITVFADELVDFLKLAVRQADDVLEVEGVSVVALEQKVEKDVWRTYLAVPEPNVLICATDKDILRDVLARFGPAATARPPASVLPEWNRLEADKRFWGVRRPDDAFRFVFANTLKMDDPPAIDGFVFSYDGKGPLILEYRCPDTHAIEAVTSFWARGAEQFGFTAEGIDVEDGIRQIRITTAMPRTMCRTMFLLWAALGHVVYT